MIPSNAAERGGDTKVSSAVLEEWSPTQITVEEQEGEEVVGSGGRTDFLPFPELETLTLVNNLVSTELGKNMVCLWDHAA